jgi:hypothetical protein
MVPISIILKNEKKTNKQYLENVSVTPSQPSPVGEGGSRSETDEAPFKISFFAKRKSSKICTIK